MHVCLLLQALEGYKEAIEAHWSDTNCLALKWSCPLSRAKYDAIRNRMAGKYVDGKWPVLKHLGVDFPRLATRYSLEKLVTEIQGLHG